MWAYHLWRLALVASGLGATITPTMKRQMTEYGRKSIEKCQKYSKWHRSPGLLFGKEEFTSGLCGISPDSKRGGGENASAIEFPHMAHLGYRKHSSYSYHCGASLISDQFLLTAAHCVHGASGPTFAKLGSGYHEPQILIPIAERIMHPQYDPSQKYNDIALLRLVKPLPEFTDYMRPACLQIGRDIGATEAIASGWGLTEWLGDASDYLLKVTLPLVDYSKCSKTFGRSMRLERGLDDDSMICAGGFDINKDTCQGDSGGPLQIVKRNPRCMYHIIGVTSFGNVCGVSPGVYTRVSNYIPWIESIVWPDADEFGHH